MRNLIGPIPQACAGIDSLKRAEVSNNGVDRLMLWIIKHFSVLRSVSNVVIYSKLVFLKVFSPLNGCITYYNICVAPDQKL